MKLCDNCLFLFRFAVCLNKFLDIIFTFLFTEILPWIPHSCYVGEKCQPSIGSCIKYAEIRDCCCKPALAKECKWIFLWVFNGFWWREKAQQCHNNWILSDIVKGECWMVTHTERNKLLHKKSQSVLYSDFCTINIRLCKTRRWWGHIAYHHIISNKLNIAVNACILYDAHQHALWI